MSEMNLKYIELFAGCGGLSLGLESSGFELYFANEYSPMASETFAYNILKRNLKNPEEWDKTLWIRSSYKKGDIRRLREDPRKFQDNIRREIDNAKNLKGKLIVGDINVSIAFIYNFIQD
jgi:DNA (cytosine-5)-methyltransferase 1